MRPGTISFGGGRLARAGTGLLSPTASNAPGWKDTHPAARNVPVVGGGASATAPGVAVRTDGMPEDRRGASRRAGLAAPPGRC